MFKVARDSVTERIDRAEAFMRRGPMRRRARSLVRGMARHHAGRVASAMAFDLFLASIPMMAMAGWVFASLADDSYTAMMTMSALLDVTPTQVTTLVEAQLGRFSGSSAVAPIALLGSWWLAASAFHRVMNVFELALRAPRRPWLTKRLIGVVCVVVAILGLGASGFLLVVISGGPGYLLDWTFGQDPSHSLVRGTLGLVTSLAVAMGLTAAFFRIAVRRPGIKRRVWPGALVAVLLGATASALFAYYAGALARFTLFYGSLAAVATVLIWLWLCCAALLVGAELNAQLEGLERHTMPPSDGPFPRPPSISSHSD